MSGRSPDQGFVVAPPGGGVHKTFPVRLFAFDLAGFGRSAEPVT